MAYSHCIYSFAYCLLTYNIMKIKLLLIFIILLFTFLFITRQKSINIQVPDSAPAIEQGSIIVSNDDNKCITYQEYLQVENTMRVDGNKKVICQK